MDQERKNAWALLLRISDGWQDLTTAPKDGTRVELMNAENGLKDIGEWCDYTKRGWLGPDGLEGEWNTENGNGDMTHWRPIQREP